MKKDEAFVDGEVFHIPFGENFVEISLAGIKYADIDCVIEQVEAAGDCD